MTFRLCRCCVKQWHYGVVLFSAQNLLFSLGLVSKRCGIVFCAKSPFWSGPCVKPIKSWQLLQILSECPYNCQHLTCRGGAAKDKDKDKDKDKGKGKVPLQLSTPHMQRRSSQRHQILKAFLIHQPILFVENILRLNVFIF